MAKQQSPNPDNSLTVAKAVQKPAPDIMITYPGRMRVHQGEAILSMGHQYSFNDALEEYVDNALDAGATIIKIFIGPGYLIFEDNGPGMAPLLLPHDNLQINAYYELMASGEAVEEIDLRAETHELTRTSFAWMLQCQSFSGKIYEEGRNKRGRRGQGNNAFTVVGNKASWTSRLTPEKAKEYWPTMAKQTLELANRHILRSEAENIAARYQAFAEHPENAPAFIAIPSTVEERKPPKYKVDFVINELRRLPTNPHNEPLSFGTRVEITELFDGALTSLRKIKSVHDHLARVYEDDILNRGCTITIIDSLSNEGRQTPNGRIINVEPTQSKAFYEKTHWTGPGNRGQYQVRLSDLQKGDKPVMLRFARKPVTPLISVPGFENGPWAEVSGYIDAPDLPENLFPWNSGKSMPLDPQVKYPARQAWQDFLNTTIAPLVRRYLESKKNIDKNNQFAELGRHLSPALSSALKNDPILSDLFSGRSPRVGPPNVVIDPKLDLIKVSLKNEHDQGAPGISVYLEREDKTRPTIKLTTGMSGTVSFGNQPDGYYRARVELPRGVRILPNTKHRNPERIHISSPRVNGASLVYHLYTGQAKRPKNESNNIPTISFSFVNLTNPEEPFSTRKWSMRIIEINTSHPTMVRADQDSNEIARIMHIAHCAASAVCRVHLPEETPENRDQTMFRIVENLLKALPKPMTNRRRSS